MWEMAGTGMQGHGGMGGNGRFVFDAYVLFTIHISLSETPLIPKKASPATAWA